MKGRVHGFQLLCSLHEMDISCSGECPSNWLPWWQCYTYSERHGSLRAILIQTSTLKYVLLYHVSYKVYCLCLLKSVYCYVVYLQKESNLMQSLCLPFLFTFSPASFNLMSVQIKPIESHNRILWTYKLHVILQNMPILWKQIVVVHLM